MTATPGEDAVSQFYEAHPYPPPVRDLDAYARAWAAGSRRRSEHLRLWPSLPFRDDHAILVAGCGTSQAAKYAARYPSARVVGIDVSAASLSSTRGLASRHGLNNLELHRLAIEDVESLGQSFDHIVCTGVLHHLADPATGLTALRAVLAPSGALDLMVYARYGRTGITMIQEYCRLLGVQPGTDEIGDLVATLRELPLGHPIRHLLHTTRDFADDDALADALLNPREQSYTVPEVFDLLAASGLRFDRWARQAPYLPQCGAISNLPHALRIASLTLVEQFAAMELFRGTMTRHSLVAKRLDDVTPTVSFTAQQWRTLVPQRVATAVAVEDRLPPGVAAALLNRAHTDPDLILFATSAERAVFDAIDGERACGEIAEGGGFFERLWWHDLIVVDASGARGAQSR